MAYEGGLRAQCGVPTPSGGSEATGSDADCLNSARAEVGREMTQAKSHVTPVGSAFSGAEPMQSQNTASGLTMKQDLSGIENDHVTEVVRLVTQQVAYQAALAATDRAMTPSLTDFLR
jgi:flagellar hook-associated protein 3 FlgL